MEEKLYFRPEDYGKGKKVFKNDKESTYGHKSIKLVAFLLALVVIVVVIIILLRGKTTTTGQYPANILTESLVCASDKTDYDIIGSLGTPASEKELEIKLLFSDNDELKSISLRNSLVFNTAKEAAAAEAVTHAAFNKGLAARGYHSEKFENKFTLMDNHLVITIHDDSQLSEDEKVYFLLTTKESPKTLQEFRKTYESKGFTCKTTEINN